MNILDKAKELRRKIKFHQTIFIVGHQNLDLDAIGSALGLYSIIKKYRRESYIIIDDQVHELGVQKIINEQPKKIFITSDEIETKKNKKNLLIIVDTNKTNLLSNPEILTHFDDIVIIDHHQTNKQTIDRGLLIIDQEASSTCEMITQLLSHYRIKISPEMATIVLSGIVLDTSNFVLKTQAKTYFSAYYLASYGANPKKVQYYLKQDIKEYIARQKTITNIEVIKEKYAVTSGGEKVKYKREELAKIASTLLQFNGIEASFVIGKSQDNKIGISARSEGRLNVGKIMEKLGGGGDHHDAATQIEGSSIQEVKEKLLGILNE